MALPAMGDDLVSFPFSGQKQPMMKLLNKEG
jgi:hypothetical protein